MYSITKYEAYENKGGEGPSATKTEGIMPVTALVRKTHRRSMRPVPVISDARRKVVDLVTLKRENK